MPHVSGFYRRQKRASDFLNLELRVIVSPLVWVLGITLWFSGTAASTLTH